MKDSFYSVSSPFVRPHTSPAAQIRAVVPNLHIPTPGARTMAKNTAVFGIYPDRIAVEEGVEHLRRAGFRNTDISVLFPENQGTKDFAHEKNTKAPEGTASGVGAGAHP